VIGKLIEPARRLCIVDRLDQLLSAWRHHHQIEAAVAVIAQEGQFRAGMDRRHRTPR